MSMRIILIGCVETSKTALETLMNHPKCELVGIVTRDFNNFNSDFTDLSLHIKGDRCPVYYANSQHRQDKLTSWITEKKPDLIFCIGWSWLLPPSILKIPRIAAIGYHPAALPKNRGRHPLIWALVLGLEETASSFFIMENKPDEGALVHQIPIKIKFEDYAKDLYQKILNLIPSQISEIIDQAYVGNLTHKKQSNKEASYWRKRSPKDGMIDWRMSSINIYNLIRGLSYPYCGTSLFVGKKEYLVWRSKIGPKFPNDIEPGKVLYIEGNNICIKCGEGSLVLIEHDIETLPEVGEYL
ncbi:formyltransferase family protein [Terasakiella sp. SH-1]|uniref:formyltransferase family protein n=1 Tax=Terasakiella sp. SH-1 TaxID=2560057 RepID=UPI001072EE98|nr:formyltransferase family protein [Terasakiella sp. SH-1]